MTFLAVQICELTFSQGEYLLAHDDVACGHSRGKCAHLRCGADYTQEHNFLGLLEPNTR
jgi:hypothetical protein